MKITLHRLVRSMAGLFAGALLAASVHAAPVFSWGGSDYFLTGELHWDEAEAEAVTLGGHLVTINSAEEQAAITAALGDGPLYWIGLSDVAVEGTWVWVSGEAVTFTNWWPGEPNNSRSGENYVHLNAFPAGAWNDIWDMTISGIVEVKQEVPEPGSLALAGLALAGLAVARRRNI